jgi:hypothetical protein
VCSSDLIHGRPSVESTYWLGRASTQRAAGGVFELT